MPVCASVSFGNTKGGCGKTTLLFQVVSAYARENPDTNVLVLDSTRVGDISVSLLGGSEVLPTPDGQTMAKGQYFTQQMQHQNLGTFTNLVHAALQAEAQPATWLQQMFGSGGGTGTFDLGGKCFQVSQANKHIPENIWLACGGFIDLQGTVQEAVKTPEARKKVIKTLKEGLEKSEKRWAIFADTDGDLDLTPYTKICIGLCSQLFVPYEISMHDVSRFPNFFWPQVQKMFQDGEMIKAPQLNFLWNKVSVLSWKDAGEFSPLFKSPKEKEADLKQMQQFLSTMVFGDSSRWKDIPSIAVPPFEQSGIKSMRYGIPMVCMSKETVKLDNENLLKVIEKIISVVGQQPQALKF